MEQEALAIAQQAAAALDPSVTSGTMTGPAVVGASSSSSALLHEREVVRSTGRGAISSFLDLHTCFSVLRASGKVVVFDTRIPIQLAFYALVEHGASLGPRSQCCCFFVLHNVVPIPTFNVIIYYFVFLFYYL